MHLVRESEHDDSDNRQIQLRLERDDGRIHIEMVDRSMAADVEQHPEMEQQ